MMVIAVFIKAYLLNADKYSIGMAEKSKSNLKYKAKKYERLIIIMSKNNNIKNLISIPFLSFIVSPSKSNFSFSYINEFLYFSYISKIN